MGVNSEPGARSEEDPKSGLAEEGTAEGLSPEVEALRAELAAQQDRFLRAKAETDNIRRRSEQEIANVRKFAIEGFAGEVLAVRDNLERARAVELQHPDVVAKVVEGLDLTLVDLDRIFERFGITVIDPVGERFDPERHQAMTTVERSDLPPGQIAAVMQKGYLLNGRLLRPALVTVVKAPAAP